LPDDVPALQAMIVELLDALKKSRHEREGLQQRLDQLLRRLYGPKAERFDPNQPWLLPELANNNGGANAATVATPSANTDATTAATMAKPKRPGHGRKKLPADLPRRPANTPTICRCIASNASSAVMASSCRARPCVPGWLTWPTCSDR